MPNFKNTIPEAEFKAKCSKPVEQAQEKPSQLFGALENILTIKGDIVSPINEQWSIDKPW